MRWAETDILAGKIGPHHHRVAIWGFAGRTPFQKSLTWGQAGSGTGSEGTPRSRLSIPAAKTEKREMWSDLL